MKRRRQTGSAMRLAEARAHLAGGRWREAATALNDLLKKSPGDARAQELLAELAFRQGDVERAIRLLEGVLKTNPDSAPAHHKLGVANAVRSRFPQAAAHLRKAVQLKPDLAPAYLDLCKVTREMGLLDESIEAGRKAVSLAPGDPRGHSTLALSFERFGLNARAHEHYVRAAELAPDDPARLFACGVSHIGAGDKQAAREAFERVLKRRPGHAQARWMLARLTRYESCSHADFTTLKGLLDKAADDEQRCFLHFALGKMHEDCGDYPAAFAHFSAGNRIENTRHAYDPDKYRSYIDALIRVFSPEFLARWEAAGNASEQPVFIVGMPRSGTTLVEQILAAHSRVFGAGELAWFAKTEHDLPAFFGSGGDYPDCLASVNAEHIRILADKYLGYINTLCAGDDYQHITDKLPANYERIGLVSLLFPRARIVHCRRDPLDNAVSQFTLLFQGNMEYSRDLYNLGRHYAEYARLMEHWQRCRPDSIIDIQYETLVQDHAGETRRLLEFLDLPWEDDCLNFFTAQRAVRTSSDFQVRQPIYASSVGRWKHYADYLQPLKRGLQGLPQASPAA